MLDVSKMEQFIETKEQRDTERCTKLSRYPDELHSIQAMLKAMLDGTRTLVVLLDTQGLVVNANRVAFALVGASIEQVVDVPFENTAWCTYDTVQVERIRESIDRASRGELVHVDLTQCTVDDDLRILDFEITPFRDEFGAIVWLVAEGHDVTELRQSEVEHGDLEQRLHHSERLEFVGRLAAGVAHDFNNLLTVMGSGLDMLRAEENHDPFNRATLDDMCEAVHSATALARQLLAFSRRQETTTEDFVVDEWVHSIAQMWRKVLSDTIVLTV